MSNILDYSKLSRFIELAIKANNVSDICVDADFSGISNYVDIRVYLTKDPFAETMLYESIKLEYSYPEVENEVERVLNHIINTGRMPPKILISCKENLLT